MQNGGSPNAYCRLYKYNPPLCHLHCSRSTLLQYGGGNFAVVLSTLPHHDMTNRDSHIHICPASSNWHSNELSYVLCEIESTLSQIERYPYFYLIRANQPIPFHCLDNSNCYFHTGCFQTHPPP